MIMIQLYMKAREPYIKVRQRLDCNAGKKTLRPSSSFVVHPKQSYASRVTEPSQTTDYSLGSRLVPRGYS